MPQPILTLQDLTAYQPGSVVSRQIIKAEKGSVTLFAFAAGEGLSEHTAPFDALAHILEGEAQIFVDGEAHLVRAGQALLLPANHPHALKAPQDFKMLLTMIRA